MNKLFALPLITALLACRPVGLDYTRPKVPLPAAFEPPAGTTAAPARWWTGLGDPKLDGLVQRALAESPDITVAEARLRQARAVQGVQDAAGGPSLALAAGVSQDRLSRHGEMFANIPFPNPQTEFTNRQVGFDASWELDFFGHNRRPDLRAAERDLAAANADVGVSLAELYPRFSLVGAAGWNSIQSNNLFSSASRMWSLGPQFSLPLFNRGLLRNQVRASQAAFDAALGTYHKAVLTALADVDVAFTRLARDEDRRRQLEESEARQRRITAITEAQVKAGELPRTALAQARRALLDQQDQAVQAQAQSLTALIAVHKALGGGWAP